MEYFDTVKNRHSVRAFLQKPVEQEKIEQVLQAVQAAPSAGNLQAYQVFVVKNGACRRELVSAAGGQDFLAGAPVVLVFCADTLRPVDRYGKRGAELYSVQDATIACSFAMLAATALELGSVWVGAFDPTAVRRVVGAAEHLLPVAILPVGYPGETPEPTSRRPIAELVRLLE